ncbi:hypothetical protein [Cystobacter fuscus]|uniref:hypothetical protein n=1 Tax=Cystobacter fuscus TaxID=43 RepID=UPI002B2ECA41|nr:hypothetical protein F0U63_10230 [Cystobacter fuscus]
MRMKLCVLGALLAMASVLPLLVPVPARPAPLAPKHPCELITVMRVPCDAATATCEYTYWECPRSVNPLRS